eukprot:scaffold3321_cov90-Isochrysis_galbana.AAC.2
MAAGQPLPAALPCGASMQVQTDPTLPACASLLAPARPVLSPRECSARLPLPPRSTSLRLALAEDAKT